MLELVKIILKKVLNKLKISFIIMDLKNKRRKKIDLIIKLDNYLKKNYVK